MPDTVDAEELARELYASAPEDFVARRGEGARQLKAAGETAAAAAFAKLAKPSLPAWLVNLLVARRPDVIEDVIARGDELRRAHTDGGGAREIRAAHQTRQRAVQQATTTAAELAERRLSESHRAEVAATLEAASADPEAAGLVRDGRLTRSLEAPTGFEALGGLTLIAGGRQTPARRGRNAAPGGDADDADDTAADESARQARLAVLQAESEAARAEAEAADAAVAELRDQLTALEQERQRLDDEVRRVDSEVTATRQRFRDAERAAGAATRRAARAQTRAERPGP